MPDDSSKTKAELLGEVRGLRQRVEELESTVAGHRQSDEALRRNEENLKRVEEALRASEAHARSQLVELEQVYRLAPVGLLLLDRDFRIVRINERLAEIDGHSVEDHLGRTLDEVVPELAPELKEIYRPVFERGVPAQNIEIHGVTPKEPGVERDWIGNYFPFRNAEGEVTGLIGEYCGGHRAQAGRGSATT